MLRYFYNVSFLCIFFIFLSAERVNGLSRQARVIGGDIINIEDAPFNIGLQYRALQICGGAVLSTRWVVTAAHCFGHVFNSSLAFVRAGTGVRAQGGTQHSIVRILKHPLFQYTVVDNDVALMEIDPPFELGPTVNTIKIPDPASRPKVGDLMNVYGWGFTKERGDPSQFLRVVELPLFPHEECEDIYNKTLSITDQMLCAGYRTGGKDACILDSGGPLVWEGRLHGLVSWGWGCGRALRPGVFTDLAAPQVQEWIQAALYSHTINN